jgi:hypothetical protein
MGITGKVKNFEFSADTTPEEVLAAIERNYSTNNPDIGRVQSCVLRNGPQIYKFAILQQIVDRHTKEHHHNALTLKTYRKFKDGWQRQDERTVSLDDETNDEISLLETFISDFRTQDKSGNHMASLKVKTLKSLQQSLNQKLAML